MIRNEAINKHLEEIESATIRDSLEKIRQYIIGNKSNLKEDLLELLITANQQAYFNSINKSSDDKIPHYIQGIQSQIYHKIQRLKNCTEAQRPILDLYIELRKKITELELFYIK